MALKGKGKQVASDSEPIRVTRASSSRRGGKRRGGPSDEAESPSSSVAVKRPRRRCTGASNSVDDDARIPVEEEEELQPEDDLNDDCVLERARQGRGLPPSGPAEDLESCLRVLKLMKDDETLTLIPFAPFVRQETECYLIKVFNTVIQLARAVMEQPIPWYSNNTLLTQEQDKTVFDLSCGTSGIPVYVRMMTESDVNNILYFCAEYCQRFLAPRLGSKMHQIKIFFGNNVTGSEVTLLTNYNDFRLSRGWSDFVKSNCIKEGNTYAFTFEEDEEAGLLSVRMHALNGIPVYIHTITEYDATKGQLVLPVEYCKRFLARRLGSEGQIKIFFGNNLTGSEVKFSTKYKDFKLSEGWPDFVESYCIEEGDTYAFTFEEDEEGGHISVRMHALSGLLGSEKYDKERPQRLLGSQEGTLSVEHSASVTRTASMHTPYLPFVCMVRKITACCSSDCVWSYDALLTLHEAAVKHFVSLYEVVNQFTTLLTPYISDGTKLTPQEEQAAINLSYDSASGIKTYVWTIKRSNRKLRFATKFSAQYLAPYLGSDKWKAKVFKGNSLTPVEVSFQMMREKGKAPRAALFGGWAEFVEINRLKEGEVCACTFEEEEDKNGAPLSLRVHLLRAAPL